MKSWWLAIAAVLMVPLVFNLWLIVAFGVNTPVFDQWWMGYQFAQINIHGFNWAYVFHQANESRPAVPLLVSYGLAHFTHWNSQVEMVLSQAILSSTAVGLVVVGRRTLGLSLTGGVALGGLSAALLMSPVQEQNLLWGIQAILYYPAACLVGCMLIATGPMPFAAKFFILIALCWISTFSYANGMSLWLIVPWLLFIDWRGCSRAARVGSVLVWIFAVGWTVSLYFDGYEKPAQHPGFGEVITHAWEAVRSFLFYLGAPLSAGGHQVPLALAFGLILLSVLAVLVGWLIVSSRGRASFPRALPWLVLAAYGLIAGLTIVVGRLGFGASYALAPRYVAFSSCVYVAAFALAALWIRESSPAVQRRITPFVALGVLLIAAMHVLSVRAVLPRYPGFRTERLQSKAATWLVPLVPYSQLGSKITFYLKDHEAGPIIGEVNRLGWLPSGLLRDYRTAIGDASGSVRFGQIEETSSADGAAHSLRGWCVLPERREPCDAVVVTAISPQGDVQPCAALFPSLPRPDLDHVAGAAAPLKPGFAGTFTCGTAARLQAWAVDVEARAFNLLAAAKSQMIDLPNR